jgi:hypothetical protein
MKKIFLIVCFLAGIVAARSQSGNQYNPMSNYVQPSPNVAAMGKYVDYPIGYYTGTPQINIPLYELKDNAAHVPISLSYHASGIRVSETASWVGLGWALNATGMITRTVRGAPDEGSRVGGNGIYPTGYYRDSGLTKMALLPSPTNGVMLSTDANLQLQTYTIPQMVLGASDGEPDLFTFSCNGYGGKFVFDEYRTPHLLTDDNVKIAVNYDSYNSQFSSWVITTPDGVKYNFGENNMNEVTGVIPMPGNGQPEPNTTMPSSWMLTSIIYPNTKDTVRFLYAPETYSYFDLAPESQLLGSGNFASDCTAPPRPGATLKTTVIGLRLTNIVSANYNISFIARTARQDLISGPYQLDSVKVFNGQNQCIQQFLLSYGYFTSTTATNLSGIQLSQINGDATDTKRLKLLSVTEFSGDGSTSKPAYTITYQETHQLPRRLSYDQDHWGFSNSFSGDGNDRFMPSVSLPDHCQTGPFGANRNPKWPDMQAFAIRTIRDPLGVTTAFTFEAHSTGSQVSQANMVGGLRIHQMTITDSVTGLSHIRLFDYGSGGNVYHSPQYLIVPNNEYYFVSYTFPQQLTYRGYSYTNSLIVWNVLKQSQSIVPMQDYQGNHIGYPMVKEIYGANGEGGSKVYWYAADPAVRGNSRLDLSNFTAQNYVTGGPYGTVNGLYGNGLFNSIAPQNLQYYLGYMVFDYYPYAPAQVDCSAGQLLEEDTYDSSQSLVRSIRNSYNAVYNETYWMRGFKAFRTQVGTSNNDALTYYKLHTGISHLMSASTTEYKDGKSMITYSSYGYESAVHSLRTSETTINSTGDTLVTKTYYSFDYANSATTDNVFGKMKNRNLLVPVSSRLWRNNQLLTGSIKQYKDFASGGSDTLINPVKMYSLETTAPLTSAQAGESIALSGQISTLIPNTYFIEKADFNFNSSTGRIIEQKLVNNKNQAMIWDNGTALPIAQVDNAYFGDVAYCSFETAETGNWAWTISSVVADNTAPTGTHGYALGSSNPISKAGLTTGTSYVVSYWLKAGASISIAGGSQTNSITGLTLNGWTYHEVTVTGTSSISITGSGNVDELRLYPSGAQMTTYTYDPLLRLSAQCSINSTISYFEYDGFNRLVDIKDQYGNIVKAYEYNYGRQSRTSQ